MSCCIGILAGSLSQTDPRLVGMCRDYVNHDYVSAIEDAGAQAVIIPTTEGAVSTLGSIDGLLLSGGIDVDPYWYGQEPHELLQSTDREFDRRQLLLTREADTLGMPILAICRGYQLLNVARGGSLYQDLRLFTPEPTIHDQQTLRWKTSHHIEATPGTLLEKTLGRGFGVNSFHHMGIKEVGQNLIPTGYAPDGLIEAVEDIDNRRFCMGVQWHPEMMVPSSELMRRLFSTFRRACDSYRKVRTTA